MAYDVRSTNRVKRVAKDLKQVMAEHTVDKSYLTCLDIASQFYGHRDYKSLERSVTNASGAASLDDELVGADEAQARRAFHVAVLATEGLATDIAGIIVDCVRPTGRATKAPRVSRQATVPTHSDLTPVAAVGDGALSLVEASATASGTPSVRSYLVEENGKLTVVSNARMMRLMRGEETWPERAGREFRFIDAHYDQVGREPVKLRWCIGLFRRFDDSGKMDDGVAEAMRLVAARQQGRRWDLSEAQVGSVMRQLKLID